MLGIVLCKNPVGPGIQASNHKEPRCIGGASVSRLRQCTSLLSMAAILSLVGATMNIANGGSSVSDADLLQLLHQASGDVQSAFPEIPGQLTLSTAFTTIWRSASVYQNAARTVLANKHIPEREKLILAYSMQNLCLNDLLDLDREALNYWKRGSISVNVFDTLVFPVYDWNTQLQQNYMNPEVRSLLLKIKGEGVFARSAGRLSYVEEVISGQAAKEIDLLKRDGQLGRRRSQC
jgi:hypothetical protein